MSSVVDTAGNLDPTGVLSATTAAVRLVGTVLNVAPAVSRAIGDRRVSGNPQLLPSSTGREGESDVTGASTTAPPPATAAQIQSLALQRVDPERETRAYETVNYVLRTIGSRILEARMVNMDALAKALTAATAHIEVKLFSGETNRLFQSLARKLNDVNLVNSVFTSIYLVGFLTAELTGSLPNYKREYPALGPLLVQQMMRVAIGEDAFRENITANLNAYQTVATTAGLLRPTDIGYSIFPDFPSFSPTRYSTKSMLDRSSHKGVLEKLVKHFDQHGFPQPLQGRDVGPIRDWRFLSSDSNSHAYEVDKADKVIGTNFGRVLYWLICSAHRMPSGSAVVGYLDQHIALIRFLGPRFGYRVLNTGGDLNMSGPHLQMNKKLRATFDTWVVIMPSETLINEKRMALVNQNQAQPMPPNPSQPQSVPPAHGIPQQNMVNQPNNMAPVVVPVAAPQFNPSGSPGPSGHRQSVSSEASSQAMKPGFNQPSPPASSQTSYSSNGQALQQLNDLERIYTSTVLPSCNQFIASPPTEADSLKKEYFRLIETLQGTVLFKIDAVDAGSDENARLKRKGLVEEVQGTIAKLDNIYREASKANSPPSRPQSMASLPSLRPTATSDQLSPTEESGPAELATGSFPGDEGSTLSTTTAADPGYAATNSHHTTTPTASPQASNSGIVSVMSASPGLMTAYSTPMMPLHGNPGQQVHPRPQHHYPTPSSQGYQLPSISQTQQPSPPGLGLQSRPSVIRRKAPPPPKRVVLAKALYDFEGDEEEAEELTFAEGDIIEIVEKNKTLEEDGWCRARVQGQKRIGLAPLDYLEELPNQPSGPPPRPSRMSSMTASEPIVEQSEPQENIATSPATKLDAKVDINVSSTSQTSHTQPNTASPASSSLPNLSNVQNPVTSSTSASSPVSVPSGPPPSYAAATSPPPQTDQGHVPVSTNYGKPPGQVSSSSSAIPHRPNQTTGQNGPHSPPTNSNSFRPPGVRPSGPLQNNSTAGPAMQNNMTIQYGPGGPMGGPYMQNMSMGHPNMQQEITPGQKLGAFVGIAEASSGFAQAGAHIFSALHGGGSNNQQHTNPSNTNHEGSNTTNNYNTDNSNNNNNQSNTSTTANNTTQNASSTNEVYSSTNQIDSNLFNNPVTNAPVTNSGNDYSIPFYPPDSTTNPGFNSGLTSLPQSASLPSTSDPNNIPSGIPTVSTSGSGPVMEPSVYPAAPTSDPSSQPIDISTIGGGAVSPFSDLSPPVAFDTAPSPFATSVSGGAGTTSPLAGLSQSPDYASTPFDTGATAGTTSPFGDILSPSNVAAGSPAPTDSSQPISPFAFMATPDPGMTASQTGGEVGGATSPFAGLASTDSSTGGQGYFSSSTTTEVTVDSASSPLAGLASTSTIDTTTITTTTDVQSSSGIGTGYIDSSSIDVTTTATAGFDTTASTGGGWSMSDYTTTTSYDSGYGGGYGDSGDYGDY